MSKYDLKESLVPSYETAASDTYSAYGSTAHVAQTIDSDLPSYADASGYSAIQHLAIALPPSAPNGAVASRTDQPELPTGWESYYDDSGTIYYFNTVSKFSQWETPSQPAAEVSNSVNNQQQSSTSSTLSSAESASTLNSMIYQMKGVCSKNSARQGSPFATRPAMSLYGPFGLFASTLRPDIINSYALQQAPLIQEDSRQFHNFQSCCSQFWSTQGWYFLLNIATLLSIGFFIVAIIEKFIPNEQFGILPILPPACILVWYGIVLIFPLFCFACQSSSSDSGNVSVNAESFDIPGESPSCGSVHLGTFLCPRRDESKRHKSVSEIVQYYSYIQHQHPTLHIEVKCWHTETRSSKDSDGNETTSSETVTTFSHEYPIPILGWKDVSQHSKDLERELSNNEHNNLAIKWQHGFVLHPTQMALIYESKHRALQHNIWRDHHTDVRIVYGLSSDRSIGRFPINYRSSDLLRMDGAKSNWLTSFFLHPFFFTLFTFCGLYFVPAMIFAGNYQNVLLHDIKFIHINMPAELTSMPSQVRRHR